MGVGPRLRFGHGEIGLMIAGWCAQGPSLSEISSRAAAAQK
jgi:hypothetical protein